MGKKYLLSELDKAYDALNNNQREFLDNHVKRGKKTKWLNVFATQKGAVLTENELDNPEEAMESLLEWVLLEYEECASVNPNMRCVCGKALKRRYTIINKSTGEIYKLGIVHFAQHTGLNPELVRLITKGLKTIDLERDELLSKILDGWTLPFVIPSDIIVPKELALQLEAGLPLLDRQLKRLEGIIKMYSMENPFVLKEKALGNLNKEEFDHLLSSLSDNKLTPQQAEKLYYFAKNNRNLLLEFGYTLDALKALSTKALGKTNDKNLRKWLVEIEYLLF